MNNWGANHGAISYGHIGADLITLASMLRIPVCMHNVDAGQIFRPWHGVHSAWIQKAPISEHAKTTDRYINNEILKHPIMCKTTNYIIPVILLTLMGSCTQQKLEPKWVPTDMTPIF